MAAGCQDHQIVPPFPDLGQDFLSRVTLAKLPIGLNSLLLQGLPGPAQDFDPGCLVTEEMFDLLQLVLVEPLIVAESFVHIRDYVEDAGPRPGAPDETRALPQGSQGLLRTVRAEEDSYGHRR